MLEVDLTQDRGTSPRLIPKAPVVLRAIGPTLTAEMRLSRVLSPILREAAEILRDSVLPAVAGAKAELLSVGDAEFEEQEHPRGTGGRFSEKPDGDPLLKAWGTRRHETISVVTELSKEKAESLLETLKGPEASKMRDVIKAELTVIEELPVFYRRRVTNKFAYVFNGNKLVAAGHLNAGEGHPRIETFGSLEPGADLVMAKSLKEQVKAEEYGNLPLANDYNNALLHLVDELKVWHGTSSQVEEAIKQGGIKPGLKSAGFEWAKKHGYAQVVSGDENRVASAFVTQDPTMAKLYGKYAAEVMGGRPVIFELTIPASEVSKFKPDEMDPHGALRIEGVIPPEWIKGIIRDAKPLTAYVVVMVDSLVGDAGFGAFEESEHPRGSGGKFAEKPDSVTTSVKTDPLLNTWSHKVNQKEKKSIPSKNYKGIVYTNDFTDAEKAAVIEYQAALMNSQVGGYSNIQSVLRTGKPTFAQAWNEEKGQEIIADLKSAFEKGETSEEMTVYRGVRFTRKTGDFTKSGEFTEAGVTSASTNKSLVKKKFGTELNPGDKQILFEIVLPKGTNVLGIDDFKKHENEKEVAIAPGTMFKVEKRSGSTIRLRAVVNTTKDSATYDTFSRLQRELDRFRAFLEAHGISVTPKVAEILRAEELVHRTAFAKTLSSSLGIDASIILKGADVAPQVRLATEASASLIKGITDDLAKRVTDVVLNGARTGQRSIDMAKELQKRFKISARRSKLIARDQLASFNANLNKVRQKQVGVKKYVWSTSLDERVRGNPSGKYPNAKPSHWAREGKVYSWSKPPSDGHPGEPINCRCVARAIIEP